LSYLVSSLLDPNFATLIDINASHIEDKSSWHLLRRFDLGNTHFKQGDKLLFLPTDAYISGIDLVSDSDGTRLLMGGNLMGHHAAYSGVMLLSYQPGDFQALMETYHLLAVKGVVLQTASELFAWHAWSRGEKYSLPGTMSVPVPELHQTVADHSSMLVHPVDATLPLARILRYDGDLRPHCQSPHVSSGRHALAMSRVLAWICCIGKLVADASTSHGFKVSCGMVCSCE